MAIGAIFFLGVVDTNLDSSQVSILLLAAPHDECAPLILPGAIVHSLLTELICDVRFQRGPF